MIPVCVVRRTREGLEAAIEWFRVRYCTLCHKRLVKYADGSVDCPDLDPVIVIAKGGYAR